MISRILMIVFFLTLSFQFANAEMQEKGADQKLEWKIVRKIDVKEKPVDIAHSLDGKYAFVLTELHVVNVYDQAGVLQGSIPVEQGVNAIALGPQGQYLHLSDNVSNTFYTLALDYVLQINTANAPTKGDLNAPVVVAVFSDFQ